MKIKEVIIMIIATLSVALYGLEGNNSIKFERYGVKEGLENLVVYDIVQDNRGYIWLGTGNGVSRFDGYEFRNYTFDSLNSNSIGSGPAPDLFIDSKGRLWIAIFSAGLYRYSEEIDGFISYTHDSDNNSINSNIPISIAEDQSGILWISTVDSGLNRLNPETGIFKEYKHNPDDPKSIPTNQLSGIVVDSSNTLWISTFAGEVYTYRINTNKFTKVLDGLKESPHLRESSSGDIWIPTAGNGVFRYDRESNSFKHFKHNSKDDNSISLDLAVNLYEDLDGHIWITTWGGGLNRYDPDTEQFKRFKKIESDSSSLSSNDTWGIFQDRTGVLWVGTYGAGLNRYDTKRERFNLIQTNPDKNSISSNNVKTIYKGSKGDLWIGTLGGGLNRYNYKTNSFFNYRKDIENQNALLSDNISMIIEDHNDDLWIATDIGLNRFNRKKNNFSRFLESNNIRSIFLDANSNLWIGTHHNGIYRYSFNGDFKNYAIQDQFLSALYVDSRNTLWVGGASSIHIYDKETDSFKRALKDRDNPDKFVNLLVTDIKEDHLNNLWIGTTTKLLRVDSSRDSYIEFTRKDGVVDDTISSLIFDDMKNLWISSSRGITKYETENNLFKNYEIGSINRNSSFKSDEGEIFIGSLDGLITFYPQDIKDNLIPPEVVITSFKVFNREVENHIQPGDEIKLNYSDNFFSFDFSALDYSDPSKNRYRYLLEGFDKEWIDVDYTRRYASYTNLDGGSYLFKVQASNSDGVWNSNGTMVPIYIKPKFIDTIAFKIIVFVAVCLLIIIISFYIFKLRRALEKQRLSEEDLIKLKKFLKDILDSMPSSIIGINQREEITLWNKTIENITKIKPGEVLGRKFYEINDSLGIELNQNEFEEAFKYGRVIYKSDRQLSIDEQVYVDTTIYPLKTQGIENLIIRIDDVTKKHKLTQKVNQSSKMDAIGQLAGGMAHDFNNILSGIINVTHLLRSPKTEINERGIKFVDMIYESSISAAGLTSKLLTFSRKSEDEFTPLDVDEILDDTLAILKRTLDRSINIKINRRSRNSTVRGNKTDLQNVIINLCINSSHAMPQGGDIEINLSDIYLTERYCSISEFDIVPGYYCDIEVLDNGTGIPMGSINRIFEPFYTTKEQGKGTGLGLSVVYGIIKNHNGSINVYSEEGVGTSFHIKLPMTDMEIKDSKREETIVKGEGTILVVDDEEIIRATSCEILEGLGYRVYTASDGKEALEIYKNNILGIDLVLMDMIMPVQGGKETFYKLREINKHCKVIISSGFTKEDDIEELFREGLKEFIHKPYRIEELSQIIAKVIAD